MKRLTIFYACVCFSLSALAQAGKTDSRGDISFHNPFNWADAAKYFIADLNTTTHKSFYRFWTGRQFIDIWSDDDLHYEGSVSDFIYKHRRPKHPPKLIVKTEKIETAKVKNIVQFFDTENVAKIPTDKDIRGWQQGLDGWVFVIQCVTPAIRSQKNYWVPEAQHCPEGLIIKRLNEKLNDVLELQARYQIFMKQLDYGHYFVGMTAYHIFPTPRKAKGGSSLFN